MASIEIAAIDVEEINVNRKNLMCKWLEIEKGCAHKKKIKENVLRTKKKQKDFTNIFE
jgi:hypothetical protein